LLKQLQQSHAEHQLEKDTLLKQSEQSRRMAEAEAGRLQRRNEAEMADLRATNSRLEVDVMKVCSQPDQTGSQVTPFYLSSCLELSRQGRAANPS